MSFQSSVLPASALLCTLPLPGKEFKGIGGCVTSPLPSYAETCSIYARGKSMLVIIQNDPEVSLGAFAGYLAEKSVPCRIVRPYAGAALPPITDLSAAI